MVLEAITLRRRSLLLRYIMRRCLVSSGCLVTTIRLAIAVSGPAGWVRTLCGSDPDIRRIGITAAIGANVSFCYGVDSVMWRMATSRYRAR